MKHGGQVSETVASAGKLVATITLVLSCIFGFILFAVGLTMSMKPDTAETDNGSSSKLSNFASGIIIMGVSIIVVGLAYSYYSIVNS